MKLKGVRLTGAGSGTGAGNGVVHIRVVDPRPRTTWAR